MYKLNKEYKGQDVTCFMPNGGVIKLEIATEEEFAKVYKFKEWQKFITVDKEEVNDIDISKEGIIIAIENDVYKDLAALVKELELKEGAKKVSKADAIILLNLYLEDKE